LVLTKVISGGQSGVDQAALRAARAAGIPTGGWAPSGWETEAGPAPWLADYGLAECPHSSYAGRTRRNVESAGAVLVLAGGVMRDHRQLDGGTGLTVRLAAARPLLVMGLQDALLEVVVSPWLAEQAAGGKVLMVAGPRESKASGIGARAEAFLAEVFRLLSAPAGAK
jgi:hypothetical protein